MPSQKILVISIVCIGIIISTWLLEKTVSIPISEKTATSTDATVSADTYQNPYDSTITAEWQKILTTLDPKNNTVTIVGSKTQNANQPQDTTLTNQMAKDYFAQYLMTQKKSGNGTVTTEEAATIAQNTLSLPEYTQSKGVQYSLKDLHISSLSDKATVKKYGEDLLNTAKNRSVTGTTNEYDVLEEAVKTSNPKLLTKLDPIIAGYKGIISDLINMTVPKDAATLHLNALNASSNILDSIEAMRVVFTDPVKSLTGISQYKQRATNMSVVYEALRAYLISKF